MSGEERQPLLGQRWRVTTQAENNRVTIHSGMGFKYVATAVIKNFIITSFSLENIKNKLPITKWLPNYSLHALQSDLVAGLTVALTVIPQGLAYARIAGLPPQYGMYSAFMGAFVYCFLGTAKDITLGPTAIMSLMTATFAMSPVTDDPTYAIVLCLMTGCVQFLMGFLHLGILVNFISYPVINAFTSAAAITIAWGQVKSLLGLKNISRDFLPSVYEIFAKIGDTKVWDLTMGLVSLVVLFFLKKLRNVNWNDNPNDPPLSRCRKFCRYLVWLSGTAANALVVISASGVVAIVLSQNIKDKISITGDIKSGLPPFKPPAFSLQHGNETISAGTIFKNIATGFAIVPILGLVELIAIAKAFARQNQYKIYPNQELIAIGIANIMSSFVSSYPVTGSFSRTAVNSQSGVKTPASGIFTGAIILLALEVLTPVFYYIPKAALAAVIISAVLQMVDYKIVQKLWKVNKLDLFPLFVTFLSSLGLGVEYGIIVGVGVSLLMLLYPMARPAIESNNLGVSVIQMDQGIKFPAVEYLQDQIMSHAMSPEGKLNSVVLDCTHVSGTDYSSVQGIIELIADFKRQNAKIVFACLSSALLSSLQDAEIPEFLVSFTVEEGCKLLQDELGQGDESNDEADKGGEGREQTIVIDFNSHL